MKLHRLIEPLQTSLEEGQGPVPVILTLDEVINAGGVTNSYQTFVLSWLVEFFKDGVARGSLAVGDPVTFGDATSTASINAIKTLTPENQVSLAMYLKSCVELGESWIRLSNNCTTAIDWIRHVLQVQK